MKRSLALLAGLLVVGPLSAALLTVTVTHDLAIARPSETITVPWSEVNTALPGALWIVRRERPAAP